MAVGVHLDSGRRRTTIREKATKLESVCACRGEVLFAQLLELVTARCLSGPDMAGHRDGGVLVFAKQHAASRPAQLPLPGGAGKLLRHSGSPRTSRCHCYNVADEPFLRPVRNSQAQAPPERASINR